MIIYYYGDDMNINIFIYSNLCEYLYPEVAGKQVAETVPSPLRLVMSVKFSFSLLGQNLSGQNRYVSLSILYVEYFLYLFACFMSSCVHA